MTETPRRHVRDVTDDEWFALMNDFADLVLARHRVIGSVAGDYSLYDALDEARDQARRRGPQADRDVLQRQCDVCGRWDLALPGDRCRAQPPCRGVYQFR
jgi:hypothetical protein